MKPIRKIALGVFLAIGALSAILYTSCSKTDKCSSVTCKNMGTCSDGKCTCTMTGTGGTLCDTIYRTLYSNTYKGTGTDNNSLTYTDTKVTLSAPSDTVYANMIGLVEMTDSAGAYHTLCSGLKVVLSNFTSTGASFNITETISNGWKYSGNGTVSGTTVKLTLIEADTATVSPLPTVTYTFNSMAKQ